MSRKHLISISLSSMLVVIATAASPLAAADAKNTNAVEFAPNQILMKVQLGVQLQNQNGGVTSNNPTLAQALQQIQARTVEEMFPLDRSGTQLSRLYRLELKPDADAFSAIAKLSKLECVSFAEPNYISKFTAVPSDASFGEQWGLTQIKCPEAWDLFTGSSDIVVAVIDTGVDYTHPDLADNMWVNTNEIPRDGIDNDENGFVDDYLGWDAVDGDGDPLDIDPSPSWWWWRGGHGTHVAGIIGAVANNTLVGSNTVGVMWNCRIMAIRAGGAAGLRQNDIIESIRYAADSGADVANMSFGGLGTASEENAILYAAERGVVLVAAAGNDNTDEIFYPAGYGPVIAVAATDRDDRKASFSSYGDWVTVSAPGVEILSTMRGITVAENPRPGNLFFDHMELGDLNWQTSGTHNTWAITEETAFSPTHAWSDSPGTVEEPGRYANNTSSYLTLKFEYDLSPYMGQDVAIVFRARCNMEDFYDNLWVQVSSDAGDTWTTIGFVSGWSNALWVKRAFLIPDIYKSSQFKFRFWFQSDSSVVGDGIYLDDIAIIAPVTVNGGNYESKSGTSMASPQVAGLAGLMVRYGKSLPIPLVLSSAQVEEIMRLTADDIDDINPGFEGLLGSGRVNADRAMRFVQTGKLPAILTSVTIDPADSSGGSTLSVTEYSSRKFVATAHYSDGTSEDWTDQVDWWARPVPYGRFDIAVKGKFDASIVSDDREVVLSATIEKSRKLYRADKIITVKNAPSVAPLAIGGPSRVDPGSSANYAATFVYPDGSTTDVTSQVEWKVISGTDYAGFRPSFPGSTLETTPFSADQTITIRARYTDTTAQVVYEQKKTITIGSILRQIAGLYVTGPTQVVAGGTIQLRSQLIYKGETHTEDVTADALWSVKPAAAGEFIAPGRLLAGAVGTETPATLRTEYTVGGTTYIAALAIKVIPAVAHGQIVEKTETPAADDNALPPGIPCSLPGILIIGAVLMAGGLTGHRHVRRS